MQAPKLSIITITYKDPGGLAETLRSLKPLLEKGLAWEHIVVDSSPEQNRAVVEQARGWSPEGWPLRHVACEPKGVYAAFNEGLRLASGMAVWFLNSGDRMHEVATLQKMLEVLENDRTCDILMARAAIFRDGQYAYDYQPPPTLLRGLLGANRVCHQSMLYRRASVARVGEFSQRYRIAGDYEHHLRCCIEGLKSLPYPGSLVEFERGGISDDPVAAFSEFRQVQLALGPRLGAKTRALNSIYWWREFARDAALKALSRSPLRAALRPLWIRWNRRRGLE